MTGRRTGGYTIIEVMMFLAVSSVLMLIATSFINGQNQANQFGQALRAVESKISDVVNTVSSGVYQYKGSLPCQVNTASQTLEFTGASPSGQGTNQACTFIGRIIQFAPDVPGPDGYSIFTVAGRRLDNSGYEIQNLDNAYPTPVATTSNITNTSNIDLTDSETIGWGLNVTRIVSASSHLDLAGIGFMGKFAQNSSSGTTDLVDGSQTANLVSPLGNIGLSASSFVGIVEGLKTSDITRGLEGAVVCFSGNGGRRGAITVSAQGATNVLIDQIDQVLGAGVCP